MPPDWSLCFCLALPPFCPQTVARGPLLGQTVSLCSVPSGAVQSLSINMSPSVPVPPWSLTPLAHTQAQACPTVLCMVCPFPVRTAFSPRLPPEALWRKNPHTPSCRWNVVTISMTCPTGVPSLLFPMARAFVLHESTVPTRDRVSVPGLAIRLQTRIFAWIISDVSWMHIRRHYRVS